MSLWKRQTCKPRRRKRRNGLDRSPNLSGAVDRFADRSRTNRGRQAEPDRRFPAERQREGASEPIDTKLSLERGDTYAPGGVAPGVLRVTPGRAGDIQPRREIFGQAFASPTVSAMVAPRAPSGFSEPIVESLAV
jgi:hypothetical protein